MTSVITPACMVCGKTSEMEVDTLALHRWQKLNVLIQVAFPDMSAPEREQLKTGTHPACWEEMFADIEDEDEGSDFADPDPMYTTDEDSPRL